MNAYSGKFVDEDYNIFSFNCVAKSTEDFIQIAEIAHGRTIMKSYITEFVLDEGGQDETPTDP